MKKSIFIKVFTTLCFLLSFLFGCSGNGEQDSPDKKVMASLQESDYSNIYDVLDAYPGLESLFTSSDMEIAEFERRLFGDFLGNDRAADSLVALVDLFPSLIDTGTTISAYMFSESVREEMKGKGPIPDLMSAIGALTKNIVEIEDEKIAPYYDYLTKLDELENSQPEKLETADYIVNILLKVIQFLTTYDDDDVYLFMTLAIKDYMECKVSADGKLDFADYEELIEKFSGKAPEGMSKILLGLKDAYYDEEIRDALAETLHKLGKFLGDDETYVILKAWLENLYNHYSLEELGLLTDHVWDEGQFIGPEIENMGVESYGENGKSRLATREFLRLPKVLNEILETLYAFEREGYGFDNVDEQLIKMKNSDPFCFDLKGEGEFGGGKFYEPSENLSYKNFSCLKGLVALLSRWNIPLTFTASFLFEAEGALESKKYIRNMIPKADVTTVMPTLWSVIYEKDEDHYMGHGKPVTEKRGYGMMIDGEWVAPVCPAIMTGASMALYNIGDSLVHGPYDNIYDNMRWLLCQRKQYMVIDLVQFIEYIPSLKFVLGSMFKLMGIKSLPVTVLAVDGVTSVIYAEIGEVIENLPKAMTNSMIASGVPEWVVPFAIEQLKKYMPVGYPVEGTDRVYLLPKDLRDLWTVNLALPYFDSNAFHVDRFTDLDNPQNNTWNYDIREYTYEKNKDVVNPMFNLVGAMTVSIYNSYREVVDPFPTTMKGVPLRHEAAREAFGGSIYPFDIILNILSVTYENTTEFPTYNLKDEDAMPFVEFLEPLFGMESRGVIDSIAKLTSLLGKPDLKKARKNITEGLADILDTVDKDSKSPYTFAAEFLESAEKAKEDPRRWDAFKLMLNTFEGLLAEDSPYQIVDDLVGFVGHLTSVEVSDEDWQKATEAIVEVFKNSTEERVFTRGLMHLTTILDAIDTKHIWADSLYAMEEALIPGGVLSYVFTGMERDPAYSWDRILLDTDTFLHSDLVSKYEEGSFWKDVFYFIEFLANALE